MTAALLALGFLSPEQLDGADPDEVLQAMPKATDAAVVRLAIKVACVVGGRKRAANACHPLPSCSTGSPGVYSTLTLVEQLGPESMAEAEAQWHEDIQKLGVQDWDKAKPVQLTAALSRAASS